MSLLLDTHILIWSQETPEELGDRTRELLIDPGKALYVSPVSTLEIARLAAKGTIRLSGGLLEWVNDTLEALSGITGFRMKLPLSLLSSRILSQRSRRQNPDGDGSSGASDPGYC